MGHVVTQYVPSCHCLWFKNSVLQWQMFKVICLGFSLVLFCFEGKSNALCRGSSFPGLVLKITAHGHGRSVHMANGWSHVYTHLMLFHTRVHPLSHVSAPVCVCVSTAASVYLRKINPIPNTYKRTWVQWAWKHDTHTLFHTHSSTLDAIFGLICALLWQSDESQGREMLPNQSTVWKARILFRTIWFYCLNLEPVFLCGLSGQVAKTVLLEGARLVRQVSPLTLLTVTSPLSVLTNPWPFTPHEFCNPPRPLYVHLSHFHRKHTHTYTHVLTMTERMCAV